MVFPRARKIKLIATVLFLILSLFANFYAIRKLARYGVEVYFYDKMLVAYRIGALPGLKEELESVLSQDKMPSEIALAKDFKKNLDKLESPEKFLEDTSGSLKKKIALFRSLRNIAILLISAILILRIISNHAARLKK